MKDYEEVDRLSLQTNSGDAIASCVEPCEDPIHGVIPGEKVIDIGDRWTERRSRF